MTSLTHVLTLLGTPRLIITPACGQHRLASDCITKAGIDCEILIAACSCCVCGMVDSLVYMVALHPGICTLGASLFIVLVYVLFFVLILGAEMQTLC